jgi:hypothetical protein
MAVKKMKIMVLGLGRMERMNHNKGIKTLEATLASVEQKGEVTATDVMLFRCRYDLTTRKRSKVGKQTSITQ